MCVQELNSFKFFLRDDKFIKPVKRPTRQFQTTICSIFYCHYFDGDYNISNFGMRVKKKALFRGPLKAYLVSFLFLFMSFFLRARRFSLSPLFLFLVAFLTGRDFLTFFIIPPQYFNSSQSIIKESFCKRQDDK